MLRIIYVGGAALVATVSPCVHAPSAHAADTVTYEVVSDDIGVVNLEYQDQVGRKALQNVPVPWRADVAVRDVRGQPPHGAEVRVDWRPIAAPSRWLTVRIYHGGKVICENTLDVGDATCYGITPYVT